MISLNLKALKFESGNHLNSSDEALSSEVSYKIYKH